MTVPSSWGWHYDAKERSWKIMGSFCYIRLFRLLFFEIEKMYLNTNINWSRSLLLVSSNGFFKASEHNKQRKLLKMKKWSSQWTQFMQLRKEAWNFISFHSSHVKEMSVNDIWNKSHELRKWNFRLLYAIA